MTVFIALAMVVLIGFLGLAVDVGHLYIVKGELQHAADAGALAGAAAFASNSDPRQVAMDYVRENKSDGVKLQPIEPVCLENESLISCAAPTPTSSVQVTVSRDSTHNGGPVPTFFARILSVGGSLDSFPVSATATARLNSSQKPHLIK